MRVHTWRYNFESTDFYISKCIFFNCSVYNLNYPLCNTLKATTLVLAKSVQVTEDQNLHSDGLELGCLEWCVQLSLTELESPPQEFICPCAMPQGFQKAQARTRCPTPVPCACCPFSMLLFSGAVWASSYGSSQFLGKMIESFVLKSEALSHGKMSSKSEHSG